MQTTADAGYCLEPTWGPVFRPARRPTCVRVCVCVCVCACVRVCARVCVRVCLAGPWRFVKVRAPRLQGRPTNQPRVMPAGSRLRNLPVSALPAHAQENLLARSLSRQYTGNVLARAVIVQAAAHGTANGEQDSRSDDDGDEHVLGFSEIRLPSGKLRAVPVWAGLTLSGFYNNVKAVLRLRWPLDVRLVCLDTDHSVHARVPALLPRDHSVFAREHVSGRAFQAVIYENTYPGDDAVYELLMQARASYYWRRSPEYARARSRWMRTPAVDRPVTPDARDRRPSDAEAFERLLQLRLNLLL